MKEKDTAYLLIYPKEMHRQVKMIAAKHEMNIKNLIIAAIEDMIRGEKVIEKNGDSRG